MHNQQPLELDVFCKLPLVLLDEDVQRHRADDVMAYYERHQLPAMGVSLGGGGRGGLGERLRNLLGVVVAVAAALYLVAFQRFAATNYPVIPEADIDSVLGELQLSFRKGSVHMPWLLFPVLHVISQ